jgi:hypothetical protein
VHPHRGHAALNAPTSRKRGRGGGCIATEARQQKARRKIQHLIYFFETSRCNTYNIYLKADKTFETWI